MTVAVFTNQKGGVGKSTLSVLFAQWLNEKKSQSVAFIDLDTQGNSSKTLTRYRCDTSASQMFGNEQIALNESTDDIVLYAATKGLADVEFQPAVSVLPAFRMQVKRVREAYDWVVIDTPPALGLRMSAALISADEIVCPIELEEYSVDGLTDMLKTIFGVQRRYNPGLHLAGVIANRFNPHSVRQKGVLHDLVAHYGEFFVPGKISTRSSIPEALASGQSIWSLPKSAAREASHEVTKVFELLHDRMIARDDVAHVTEAA